MKRKITLFFSTTLFCLNCSSTFSQTSYPKVKIESLENFMRKDEERLQEEIKILESILENNEFWSSIKNAEYFCSNRRIYALDRGTRCEYNRRWSDTKNYTGHDVYDILFNGDDEIGSHKDGIINLKLKLYNRKRGSRALGSTSICSLVISSGRRVKLHSDKKGDYALHLLHEYMHILGFKHKRNNPKKNRKKCGGYDIPWKVQRIAEEILNQQNKHH